MSRSTVPFDRLRGRTGVAIKRGYRASAAGDRLRPLRCTSVTIVELPADALAVHGLRAGGRVLRNPSTSQLSAAALDSGEGVLSDSGGLVVDTGRFTGRSPKDKFIVREPGSEDRIGWGDVNQPISEENFDGLR